MRATFTTYNKYEVRVTRWQVLKTLFSRNPLVLPGSQVTPLVEFGSGTSKVNIEAWGGGGGGGGGHSSAGGVWGR